MHVISRKALRVFWTANPQAEGPLKAWFKIVDAASWGSFAEMRRTFPSADLVGRCTVFNVGGNNYRLVAVIHYNRGKIYIRRVMKHQEYDRGRWKDECC